MPETAQLRAKSARDAPADAPEIKAYEVDLWLPSTIGKKRPCDPQLQECEWDIREGQAHDALHELRQYLRLETFLRKRKKDWDRGVRQNTRSQTAVRQSQVKIEASSAKYRAAHGALCHLAPLLSKPDAWTKVLKPLADDDVKGIPLAGIGEGRVRLSWIWLTAGAGETDQVGMHDGMCVTQVYAS